MWDQQANWRPRSSFAQKVPPPPYEPGAPPFAALYLNRHWLPYLLGAAQQLCQPQAWDTGDPALLALALDRARTLLSNLGLAGACPPPGPLPIGNGDDAWTWLQSSPGGCLVLGAGAGPAPLANGDAAGTWIFNAPGGRYILN
jgi:hypothetical protein